MKFTPSVIISSYDTRLPHEQASDFLNEKDTSEIRHQIKNFRRNLFNARKTRRLDNIPLFRKLDSVSDEEYKWLESYYKAMDLLILITNN